MKSNYQNTQKNQFVWFSDTWICYEVKTKHVNYLCLSTSMGVYNFNLLIWTINAYKNYIFS